MKAIYSFLLLHLLLTTCCALSANAQWEYVGSPQFCEAIDIHESGDTIVTLCTSGLFFATDGGEHWTHIPLPSESHRPERIQLESGSLYLISEYIVDPEGVPIFFKIVHRSDNWGAEWKVISELQEPKAGFITLLVRSDTCYFITLDSIHVSYDRGNSYPDVYPHFGRYTTFYLHDTFLFANATINDLNLLLRSADDGQTWDTVYIAGTVRHIKHLNTINGELWMIEHIPQHHICGVHKSQDAGDTWIFMSEISDLQVGTFDNDPEKILGHGQNLYMTAFGYNRVVYHSADGGTTFTKTLTTENEKKVFYAGQRLFFTFLYNFLSSQDHGQTFDTLYSGLTSAPVKHIAISENSIWTSVNYKHAFKLSQGHVWQNLSGFSDIGSTRNGHLLSIIHDSPYVSADEGLTWTFVDLNLPPFDFFLKIMCAGDLMMINEGNSDLYISFDYGQTWKLSSLEFAFNLNFNNQYIIESLGEILVSNNGEDWESIPWPEHPDFHFFIDYVYWLPPYYFMSSSDLLLRLHQDSSQWEKVIIPTSPVHKETMPMISHHEIFFISIFGKGVFASYDYGDTWISVNEGLSNYRGLSMTKNDEYIYLGVDGGVWRRSLEDFAISNIEEKPRDCFQQTTIITRDVVPLPTANSVPIQIALISSDGRYLHYDKSSSLHELQIDKYPSGLYFLSVLTSECRYVLRVVKI